MALTAYEADLANQNRRNNMLHEISMVSRRRRTEVDTEIARDNPGRFSAFETRALTGMQHTKAGDIPLVDRQERAGLQKHELDMLRQKGENEIGVAEKNAFGMQHQGEFAAQHNADAARYRADQDVKIADINQKGLTEREKAIAAGSLEVEKTRQAGAKSVAETQGEWNVKQQSEANKGLIAKTEYEWQQKEKQIAADIQKRTIAAGSKVDAAKVAGHAKIISDALKAGALSSKDASTVLAELAEANKNNPELLASITAFAGQNTTPPPGTQNPPKDGERRQTKQGMAVYRNGKWVLEAQ